MQKGVFYIAKEHLLFCYCELLFTKDWCVLQVIVECKDNRNHVFSLLGFRLKKHEKKAVGNSSNRLRILFLMN